jgi:lipoprotein-anchoring transpeptidase ErfK/SrfK
LLVLGVFASSVSAQAAATPSASQSEAAPSASQQLAVLNQNVTAYSSPDLGSKRVGVVNQFVALNEAPTTLPVLKQVVTNVAWIEVLLPGRPNSHTGWIMMNETTMAASPWRITVRLSTRTVQVFERGSLVHSLKAVVGKPSTPTPTGSFYVETVLHLKGSEVGSPYALALSARSNVFQEFDGGPGQIALHGTDNIGGDPGHAESHGCVRLATGNITWLGKHIDAGTTVTITR